MKQANRKLVVRGEVVRTLANADLVRAVGGYQTADKMTCVAIPLSDDRCAK